MVEQGTSNFLIGLFLEENNHLNPIDFIDKNNKISAYSSSFTALALAKEFEKIRDSFIDLNSFSEKYFEIYTASLEKYMSVTENKIRNFLFNETNNYYHLQTKVIITNSLIDNIANQQIVLGVLENTKNNHSYAIISRNEMTFIIIHYENDNFIVLDPYVECSGILSKDRVLKFITYDHIWNFDVHIMIPN